MRWPRSPTRRRTGPPECGPPKRACAPRNTVACPVPWTHGQAAVPPIPNPCPVLSAQLGAKGFVLAEDFTMLMVRVKRPATRPLRGWAISVMHEAGAIKECEEHSWMQEATALPGNEVALRVAIDEVI